MRSTVRPATAGDAPRLRVLQAELTAPTPALLNAALPDETAYGDAGAPTPEVLPTTAEAFTLLVSVDAADIAVGYLLALAGETTHIAELVVDPAARREGRGRALLGTLIEQAPTPITVHVAADNTAAQRLYRSVGFQQQDRTADRFEHADGLTLRYPAED
jgi:ribosomal-protein-alanine N-acetyltransferase